MNARARSVPAVAIAAMALSSVAPRVHGQTTLTPVASVPWHADLVRAQGQFVYLASSKTLGVIDVSNPSAPKRGGEYVLPEQIWGFRVVGARA